MKKYFLILLGIFLSQSVLAQQSCEAIFSHKLEDVVQVKQVQESKNKSQLLRSNSPFYWQWVKLNASKYFPATILSHVGNVVGDAHNKNFGVLKYLDKIVWTVLDLDDAGRAPLILDFSKFVAAIKSVDKSVKARELWSAYLLGLNGQQLTSIPLSVQEALGMSSQKYRKKEIKKAKKFTNQQGTALLNDGIESTAIQNEVLKKTVLNLFTKAFQGSSYRVVDVGAREKDRGGSKEALRFVALVRGDDGFNTIYELKEYLGTSVENYLIQSKTNLEDAVDYYIYSRAQSDLQKDVSYQILNAEIEGVTHQFLLRPKQIYLFDEANSSKLADDFKYLSIYNAWFMGHLHGEQVASKQYRQEIENDQAEVIFEGVKSLAKDYLVVLVNALNSK